MRASVCKAVAVQSQSLPPSWAVIAVHVLLVPPSYTPEPRLSAQMLCAALCAHRVVVHAAFCVPY